MKCDECDDEFVSLGTGDTTCEDCIDMMDDGDYDDDDSDLWGGDDSDYDDGDELLERQELSDFAQDEGDYYTYGGDSEYSY